jgi:hypothetical protein
MEAAESNHFSSAFQHSEHIKFEGYKGAFVAFLMKYCQKWLGQPNYMGVLDGNRRQPHLNRRNDS